MTRRFWAAMLLSAGLAGAGGLAPARAQDVDGVRVPAPELETTLKWLNSQPLKMSQLKGRVVLIDFWEYTCVNCIRTLPYVKSWHERYKDKGLVVIGVHTPEFAFAKLEANVAKSAKDAGLTYPIVIDSDYAVWRAYGNRFWPAKYLINKDGFVRYFHFGEGGYGATEQRIQKLLREANPQVQLPPILEPIRGSDKPGAVCYPVTPELYAGFERGGPAGTLGNREGYRAGTVVSYTDPGRWLDGKIYVQGAWKNTPEAFISTRDNPTPQDYLAIRYHALEVNSVIHPEDGKPAKVWVEHDGRPVAKADAGQDIRYDEQGRSFITVNEGRMYYLIKNAKFGQRTLKLAPANTGVGIYSYTFVSCETRRK